MHPLNSALVAQQVVDTIERSARTPRTGCAAVHLSTRVRAAYAGLVDPERISGPIGCVR